MPWAQNLLGFCLFACASQTPFSWVWPGGLQASKSYVAQRFALLEATFFFVFSRFQKQRFGSFLAAVSHGLGTICFFLMGSNSDVSAFFRLRFRNGLGTKPAGVLLFRMRVPNTFFLSLVWWLAGFQVLRCAKVCFAWGNLFFVFSRFQMQRFGIFLFSAFFVGSKSNVSAVFWLRFRMVWAYISFFLMGSNSDVSAFFRLRFRNGLGTKPAARPKHLFLEFGLVACRFFLCF